MLRDGVGGGGGGVPCVVWMCVRMWCAARCEWESVAVYLLAAVRKVTL